MKGVNHHRLPTNAREQAFTNAWATLNHNDDFLSGILTYDILQHGDYQPTDSDKLTAATLMQWLGSPVGEHWVRNVLAQEI